MGRAILGEVEFSVIKTEEPTRENIITEKAVENGANINDHVEPRPISFAITGVVVGPDAGQKLSKLGVYRNRGERLTYVGRNLFRNMVIENLTTSHTAKIRDGFAFEMTLKQVRIAKPETATYVAPDPAGTSSPAGSAATKAQVKPVENKGTLQPLGKLIEEQRRKNFLSASLSKLPPHVT